MLNTKQILVIVGSVLLFGVLIMQPIKGLVKEDDAENPAETAAPADAVSAESVYEISKQGLNASLRNDIENLEIKLEEATGHNATELHTALAGKWMDVNKPAPAAFHLEAVATNEPSIENWLKSGNAFTDAFEMTQDTLLGGVLVAHAISSYSNALELDPENLEAKTGLGSAYVH